VVLLAQRQGFKVLAPCRSEVDWTDAAAVSGYIASTAPDVIIHLASPGVFGPDPNDPALIEQECSMMQNLLSAVPFGCRIIGGGSMAEYGQSGRLREDMACYPNNAYARAKLEAGQLLVGQLQAGVITGCHARIFGAYGPGEAPRRLLPMVITRLRAGEPVALSDCRQQRDFVYVDDIADSLLALALASAPLDPVINLGTGTAIVVRDVVEQVADELGASRGLLNFGAVARSPHDQDKLEADTARLFAATGHIPVQHFLQPKPVLSLIESSLLFSLS
jgi:nucleoside-diphosphate-sugar epimerase